MVTKALFKIKITLETENNRSKNYVVNEEILFKDENSNKILKQVTRRIRNILTNIAKYGEADSNEKE
jgi:hypothetical protein